VERDVAAGLGLAAAVSIAAVAYLAANPVLPPAAVDERPGFYQDPGQALARIQTDMDRLAAGEDRQPLPAGIDRDPLEDIVELVDSYRTGKTRRFDSRIEAVREVALARLVAVDSVLRKPDGAPGLMSPSEYGRTLAGTSAAPLTRLLATLRQVDAVLVMERAAKLGEPVAYDLTARKALTPRAEAHALDDMWLRLPCQMVAGRAQFLAKSAENLGKLAGPLSSCAVPVSADAAELEAVARAPQRAEPRGRRQPLPRLPPFTADPAEADSSADRLAQVPGDAARLDEAMFRHAFQAPNPARDTRIAEILTAIDATAQTALTGELAALAGPARPYDGSDESVAATLRRAVNAGIGDMAHGTYVYPYIVPCPIARQRPRLLELASAYASGASYDGPPVFDSPLSGCLLGRPDFGGFAPAAAIATYVDATAPLSGGLWTGHPKWPRFPPMVIDLPILDQLATRSRRLLDLPEPLVSRPYVTWGTASLSNHAAYLALQPLYDQAKAETEMFLKQGGWTEEDAATAARRALFALSFGANCGDADPPDSLRTRLIDKAEPGSLAELLRSGLRRPDEMAAFARCAAFADQDPLLHLAAGHPDSLPALLELAATTPDDPEAVADAANVDGRNAFGKTALMAAAQADQLESVKFLLKKGAKVDLVTWDQSRAPALGHDGRTALMYAAANASAPVIEELLDSGADPWRADTTGLRAVHYLLGLGPVPPNPKLSDDERKELLKRLR
jgi:hypothetical protein